MHLKRWITGLAALPFLVYLIYSGGALFTLFIAAVSVVSLWEYFKILFEDSALSDPPRPGWGIIPSVGIAIAPVMVWTAHTCSMDAVLFALVLHLILCALISLVRFKTNPRIIETVVKSSQGMIYIPLMLAFAVWIRDGVDGMRWVFFILAVVFAGDIGAFYAGTYWGRHKLCPSVSPGKTIEGAVGGLTGNLIVGTIVKLMLFPRLPWAGSLVLFLVLGVVGQIGDLYESEFKRTAGVKDSGSLLPGHGGLLDRIDALLFALPVAYFFIKFIL
ncbi:MULTISPECIES: phosphatidate cytidylyltransferase [Desulfococcus]|jgi:phosphatidate cytidylyltransferase|uniref:Phosphatidate cytidylyltransferase n=1 Tax=Desulfococcus multivorans DSM 2059 TaxID=1121405 RepID=S7TWG3_DESML|nr:phosphatidate cytidylyltransferase [Desulfococcus multivorans]AOY58039.1 CdsA: predicted phosphatidate cytidylyltransferase [Desulfococcus multivorans]AQV00401.1 phosphatidate cytidylyltransferase [Desulfococcus multivorans]EPR41391.1 phosphatidate cytidylyltransferase [Desulfococcus multivorans DSM 2059]MDX9817584.1 phosphatidate cytidylyltransferase [Desulfococcus multivorans]SJZ70915.1 phosphatidate cytidylyltransferase [Desulfococcus multivorans DSM 2059]